jgi:hypothetical protein
VARSVLPAGKQPKLSAPAVPATRSLMSFFAKPAAR